MNWSDVFRRQQPSTNVTCGLTYRHMLSLGPAFWMKMRQQCSIINVTEFLSPSERITSSISKLPAPHLELLEITPTAYKSASDDRDSTWPQ